MAKTKLTTIATFTSDTPIGSVIPTKPNKAALVRALLKQKKTPKQIAAEVGCKPQYVYSVQTYEKTRAKKLRAKRQYERRLELLKGAPKRKYVKSGKYAKKAESGLLDGTTFSQFDSDQVKAEQAELHELNAQFIKQLQEATKPKIQYIEVEVPQPFSHFTFWQRLRILFLGGAA